jgi:RsiW-degrading membrane proteinase PrsW (M82 family)
MALFMLFAELYGVFQLLALASLSRTIRWRTVLVAFIVGFSACALATLAIEAGWAKLLATLSGHSLSSTKLVDAYTSDPFVEEICKALPLLLVLAIARVRRQLGLADAMLMGAALGCGFGFVENALRFTHNPGAATWVANGGYWQIRSGSGLVLIPGLAGALESWLPSGAETRSLFARAGQTSATNVHLAWSALVGLSVGVMIRGRGKWKWAALVPFLIACLSHVGTNAAIVGASFAGPLAALAQHTALFAVLALVVAVWADHQVVAAALRDEASMRLAAERGELSDAISLISARTSNPWALIPLWSFVLERRSFAFVKAEMPDDERVVTMRGGWPPGEQPWNGTSQ